MKKISRILTTILCCAPLAVAHAGTVATTAGSNLTAYHASNVNNNQWATMSNGRYDGNTTNSVKSDLNNCNSLILRCAQPKCSNGGCTDMSVATDIVEFCVKANDSCKQYHDDLIKFMPSQLVASSNAKINEQQLAAQQAAAAAANEQSQQQMAAMQQQMQKMQQQMIQQQQESQQQLQDALAQQAAQSAAAIAEMKSAATDATKQTEAGVSSYQQEAIDRGISTDILERQTMGGQIKTDIEDAEASITTLKKTLDNIFEYAKCDSHGNNCEGPKRVKKWREMAKGFIDPYDNAINKVYDAIEDAQMLGVDLSQIYMMLDNSCSRWAQYLCPQMENGQIYYNFNKENAKSKPTVCRVETTGENDEKKTKKTGDCVSCTMLKVLSGEDAVYEGWINAETETENGNTTVVACASGVLDSTKFFARRARKKNGADLVDLDVLERWLTQTEPNYIKASDVGDIMKNYCQVEDVGAETLQSAALSRVASTSNLCDGKLRDTTYSEECPYINPLYAICDTHPYNAGYQNVSGKTSSTLSEQTNKTKEIIGLKTTVVSQQLYKQYEYLKATIRRLKIQLKKAIVKTNLEAAGATDSSSSSSGGLAGGSSSGNSDKTIHLSGAANCSTMGDFGLALNCISNNANVISSFVKSQKKNACLQLQETVSSLAGIIPYIGNSTVGQIARIDDVQGCGDYYTKAGTKECHSLKEDDMNKCVNSLRNATMRLKNILEKENNQSRSRLL